MSDFVKKPAFGRLKRVYDAIGEEAAWMCLAEEANELSKAAMKMARFKHGTNTVYIGGEAVEDSDVLLDGVVEELADVCFASTVVGASLDYDEMIQKLDRWMHRLGIEDDERGETDAEERRHREASV